MVICFNSFSSVFSSSPMGGGAEVEWFFSSIINLSVDSVELERVVAVEGRTSLRIFLLVVGRLTRFSVSDDEDLSKKKDVSKDFQIHTCIFQKKLVKMGWRKYLLLIYKIIN